MDDDLTVSKIFCRSKPGWRHWCNNVRWWGWYADGFLSRSIWWWRAWHDGIWSTASNRIWKVTYGESSAGIEDWTETGDILKTLLQRSKDKWTLKTNKTCCIWIAIITYKSLLLSEIEELIIEKPTNDVLKFTFGLNERVRVDYDTSILFLRVLSQKLKMLGRKY